MHILEREHIQLVGGGIDPPRFPDPNQPQPQAPSAMEIELQLWMLGLLDP